MDFPSYWYTSVDPETKRLAEELNQLGGGDAAIANFEAHCFLDSRDSSDKVQTLWRFDQSIGVQDPPGAERDSGPSNNQMKYVEVASTAEVSSTAHRRQNFQTKYVILFFHPSSIIYS